MYNNYPYNQYWYNDSLADKNLIFNVIERGINILRNNIDEILYNSWQEYAKSAVKLYAERTNLFIYNNYLTFISTIINLPPYQKLKASLDYLLNMARTT